MYVDDIYFIKNADLIIFAGGGLVKYKREKFYLFIPKIIEIAEENNIPVFINGTGVEGYDADDERCIAIANALNSSCVKRITVRDDLDTLKNMYITTKKDWIEKVLDPAAFASETYDCRTSGDSDVIGLGICRSNLFIDYGHDKISEEFMQNFWINTIKEIEKLGYKWQFFCNGLYDDYSFGLKILENMNIRENIDKYLLRRPTEGRELANIISGYKAIIAPRLHTNIIAYSVGVPSVGLVWNDKLKYWGENIGYPERFVETDNITPQHVVKLMCTAIHEGCTPPSSFEKNKITESLSRFIKKYGLQNKDEDNCTYNEMILIANALGGKNHLYNNMNSPDTFLEKYNNGFRWFEVDLSVTNDNHIVCVNGWGKQTMKHLGYHNIDDYPDGLSYSEFIRSKYFDKHYSVMDLNMMIEMFNSYPDVNMIFDIRGYSHTKNNIIISELINKIKNNQLKFKKIVLRVASIVEVDYIKQSTSRLINNNTILDIMYDVQLNECDQSVCMDPSVKYISIRNNICNESILNNYKKTGKEICIFTTNTLSKINYYAQHNISLIATDYLYPKNLALI